MGIYVGDDAIKCIYLGDTPLKAVYLGDTKIRPTQKVIEWLLIGGGGAGGGGCCFAGGGGGAGGVIYCNEFVWECDYYDVTIGAGGYGSFASVSPYTYDQSHVHGGDSCFAGNVACGGGEGGSSLWCCWKSGSTPAGDGGSGGGQGFQGTVPCCANQNHIGTGVVGQGNNGGTACSAGGGGGGYSQVGYNAPAYERGGDGGEGYRSDISGECVLYASGGGGGGGYLNTCYGRACTGAGRGGYGCCKPANATAYGSGGGGSGCSNNGVIRNAGGCGASGVFFVRYPTSSGYNLVGGCKYTCGDYTIHRFTEDDILYDADAISIYYFNYLMVGGGGGGLGGGGGGGDVCVGSMQVMCSCIPVVVGCGGLALTDSTCFRCLDVFSCPGGDSCVGDIVAKGGCGASTINGGASGSGCAGGNGSSTTCNTYGAGGGGGATGNGVANNGTVGGNGGAGKCGYGGGGGGGGRCCTYGGQGVDGGGCGNFSSPSWKGGNATNYGGGGGGGRTSSGGGGRRGGNGCQGVVDICYLIDGSCGFTTATGGNCCYECDGYCVHRFTSDGTFTIVS